MSRVGKNLILALLVVGIITGPAGMSPGLASTAPAGAPVSSAGEDVFLDRLIKLHDLEIDLVRASAEIKIFAGDLREFGFPAEAAWMTKHILLRAYEPVRFLKAFKNTLSDSYNSEYAAETIRWLKSPLGKKFFEMEARGWSPEAVDERVIYSELLASFPPPEARLNAVERLEAAWSLTELAMGRIVPIVRLWFPHRDKMIDESPRILIEKIKKKIREPLREEILRGSLYTYLDMSDEELGRLAEFAESNAGQWYGKMFLRGLVTALDEQVMSSNAYLNRFMESVESGRDGIQILMEAFPPGERYVALRKRDPFKPLVSEKGEIMPAPQKPKKPVAKFRDKLKDFPIIPLELYKKIEKEDPGLFADLEFHQELFNDKQALQAMNEDEYFDTVDRYRDLIEKANRTKSEFARNPLQIKYEGLKFVGVIWNGKESLALVETEDKKGHVLRKGTIVGPNLGAIDSIDEGQIVVVERFKDYLGEVLAKRKKIKFSGAS